MTGSLIWTVIANANSHQNSQWLVVAIVWFCIAIVSMIADALYPKPIAIWHSVGAVFAGILSLLKVGLLWQFIVFTVVSFLALMFFSMLINKGYMKRVKKSNIPDKVKDKPTLERLINQKGLVVKNIEHNSEGLVKVFGLILPAVSLRGMKIRAGTDVVVKAVRERMLGGISQFLGGAISSRYVLLVMPLRNSDTIGGSDVYRDNN